MAEYPGPAALGHDPVVLGDQRRKVLDTIEGTGVVSFRAKGDPALPFLKDPRE